MTFICLYWTELGKLQGHFQDKPDLPLLVINRDNTTLWQWSVCDNLLQNKMPTICFLTVWHHKDIPTMKYTLLNLRNTLLYCLFKSMAQISTMSVEAGFLTEILTIIFVTHEGFSVLLFLMLKGKIHFIIIMQISTIYNSYILWEEKSSQLWKFCLSVCGCFYCRCIIVHSSVETSCAYFTEQ